MKRLLFNSALGNCRVPKDELNFAFLVVPSFVDGYRQHVATRREKKEGVRRATSTDKALLELMRSLFHPEYGWITQSPEFAQSLKPITGDGGDSILSAEQIAEIQADWPRACKKAHEKYDDWVKATKVTNDVEARHRPFVAILALQDPMLAFRLGIAGIKAELAKLDRDSMAYHWALRDAVLWGLQAQRAFRRKNGAWLRYEEDNTGNVRREGKKWRIKISAADFKNGGGEYFGRGREIKDFDVLIIDANGLYDLIEEYVTRSRPALLGGRNSSAFFVGKNGKDLEEPGIVQAITRIYRCYVMWDQTEQTGIKGALNVSGLHWMRAVLATGILKRTNDRQLAADAIHDSVRTIEEHYLRYLPADRAQSLDRALEEGLSDPGAKT